MSSRIIEVCHLYPEHLNLYGDRGNILALERRAAWHKAAELRVHPVGLGDEVDFSRFDLLFIGGGQDQQQSRIAEDLTVSKGEELRAAVEDGLVVLAICGGYQLFGEYYAPGEGERLPGLGIFPAYTTAGERRMIGNVVIESDFTGRPNTLVGFENHSGRTFLREGAVPLGHARIGYGNNGQDGTEGCVAGSAVGTYLHGSLLPKNPWLGDWLLERALARRYGQVVLSSIDDHLEELAHERAVRRAEETWGRRTGIA